MVEAVVPKPKAYGIRTLFGAYVWQLYKIRALGGAQGWQQKPIKIIEKEIAKTISFSMVEAVVPKPKAYGIRTLFGAYVWQLYEIRALGGAHGWQ